MSRAPLSEAHVSIRLIWPFARLMASYPRGLPTLSKAGIGPAEYASPDTRIPHRLAIELLNAAIQSSGDATLGLRAGELIEAGDFDALEYAARSSATVRESFRCVARHVRLMNDAAELSLIETGEHGIVRYGVTDGVAQPPAANDFITAALVTMARRNSGRMDLASEIQFAHSPVTYVDEYARVFRTKVTFNAPCNAIVTPRDWLDSATVAANPRVSAAFELQVQKLQNELQQSRSTSDKVRSLIVAHLSHGDVGMAAIARKLAMSVPTLRRRLEAEGMTYSDIVDKSREGLARQYLCEKGRSVTDVVFLLGFSDVPSFHKAFRRWTGMTPAEYRSSESKT